MTLTALLSFGALPTDDDGMLEIGFWLLALLVTGYVLLLYAAFSLFASDSNRRSALGAALLLLLVAVGLLPLYWMASQ